MECQNIGDKIVSDIPDDTAHRLFQGYLEGDYKNVSKGLKALARKRHPLALQYYGDICRANLDDQPHTLDEAAMYYLLAAFSGNGDILAWLESIDERIITLEDPDTQMDLIVNYWEKNAESYNTVGK